MAIQTAPAPLPDSVVNHWLEPVKAAGTDAAAIDAALDWLLADPIGRASLVEHLADFAALATEPSLTDVQRGRWLRQHFPSATVPSHDTAIGPNIVDDNSIVRGVGGWNR